MLKKTVTIVLFIAIASIALKTNVLLAYDADHTTNYLDVTADFRDMYFFNKKLYLVSFYQFPGDYPTLKNYKYNLENEGRISEDGKALVDAKVGGCAGMNVKSVVYKGSVYVFYDKIEPDPAEKNNYKIFYKTSSDPDTGWLPADDSGFDTGIKTTTYNSIHASFKPVVFNDLLYIFYWNNDGIAGINYKCFDGMKWSDAKHLPLATTSNDLVLESVKPYFFAEPVVIKDNSYVCMGVRFDLNPSEMQLFYIDRDNNIKKGPLIRDFTSRAQANNSVSAAFGSLGGGKQQSGNMLQIFAYNCAAFDSNVVTREINLDTGEVFSWRDTNMAVLWFDSKYTVPLPVVTAAVGLSKKSFRQYIIVLCNKSNFKGRYLIAYDSDYLQVEHDSGVISTSDERGCWNLIGVVEGCPPFTRNGTGGESKTSSIVYGYSKTKNVKLETKYGLSLSLKGTLGNDSVSIGGQTKQTFGVNIDSSSTMTYSLIMPLSNVFSNKNGKEGWLLYAQPSLRSRTYQKFANMDTGKKNALCEYTAVNVESVAYAFIPYSLAHPPKGMIERAPSTDLESWKVNKPVENVHFINTNSINPLTVNLAGQESCTSKLTFDQSETVASSMETTMTISGKAAKKDMFELETEGSVTLGFTTSTTTSWSDSVEANLSIVPPEEGTEGILSMEVTPLWYIVKDNVYMSDFKKKPYWVPDSHTKACQSVPWCVSWVVNSYRKGKYYNANL